MVYPLTDGNLRRPVIPGSALPTQILGEYQEKHDGGDDCRDSAGELGLIAENKY